MGFSFALEKIKLRNKGKSSTTTNNLPFQIFLWGHTQQQKTKTDFSSGNDFNKLFRNYWFLSTLSLSNFGPAVSGLNPSNALFVFKLKIIKIAFVLN